MLGIDVQAALRAKDAELLALEAELRAQIQTNERQGEEGEELSLQVHPDQPFACKCSPPRLDRRGAEPANRVVPRAPDLPLTCTRSPRRPSCSSFRSGRVAPGAPNGRRGASCRNGRDGGAGEARAAGARAPIDRDDARSRRAHARARAGPRCPERRASQGKPSHGSRGQGRRRRRRRHGGLGGYVGHRSGGAAGCRRQCECEHSEARGQLRGVFKFDGARANRCAPSGAHGRPRAPAPGVAC